MLNVLVPLDGSVVAEAAVAHVLPIIRPFVTRITLLRVVSPSEYRSEDTFSRVDWQLKKRLAESYLRHVAQRFQASGIPCDCVVEEGQPADVILATARKLDTHLLVMCTHGRGEAVSFACGGEASKTLSAFGASVMLINARGAMDPGAEAGEHSFRHLLVPVDGSYHSESAFRVALVLAEVLNSELTVVLLIEKAEPPKVVGHDPRVLRLCREAEQIARAAADSWLAKIRAQVPVRVPLRTSILFTRNPCGTIDKILSHTDADLIVASDTLMKRSGSGHDSRLAEFKAPMLLLHPDGAGQAFRELRPDIAIDPATSDVS